MPEITLPPEGNVPLLPIEPPKNEETGTQEEQEVNRTAHEALKQLQRSTESPSLEPIRIQTEKETGDSISYERIDKAKNMLAHFPEHLNALQKIGQPLLDKQESSYQVLQRAVTDKEINFSKALEDVTHAKHDFMPYDKMIKSMKRQEFTPAWQDAISSYEKGEPIGVIAKDENIARLLRDREIHLEHRQFLVEQSNNPKDKRKRSDSLPKTIEEADQKLSSIQKQMSELTKNKVIEALNEMENIQNTIKTKNVVNALTQPEPHSKKPLFPPQSG